MLSYHAINDLLLSSDLLLFADLIWLLVLVQAVRSAPWRFLAHSTRQTRVRGRSGATVS
ncbi:MAG: hypothetical protein IPL59_16740 [Candidatus Competibacteraceae bacterium]|nr:hypothetical protein [Candidatus Competibacteraceae bacterium]